MSTDDLDARLQQAGAHWRERNTGVAAVDLLAATSGDGVATMVPLVVDRADHPRRRRWIWLSSAAGIAAAVAAALIAVQLGGGNTPKPQPATASSTPLVGTQWQLAALRDGQGIAVDPVPPASFQIDSAYAVGFPSTGCGKTTGRAAVHADQVTLTDLSTKMSACPIQAGEAANAVLPQMQLATRILTGTVQWSITADTLTLTKPGVGALTYRAMTQAPITEPKALVGVWSLVTITSPSGASANPARPANLNFASNTFSGTDGCNTLSGDVTVTSGRVDFGNVTSTAMGCVGADVNAESSAIDAILGNNVSWSIQNDRLTLTKDGAGSLTYRHTDIDPGFSGKTGGPANGPSATPTK